MKFRDDVYLYEWTNPFENNCNSYYIGGTVGALIDPGLSQFVPDLLERMRQDGVDPEAIRRVINTHSHPDHFEGSQYFADKSIPIGMHKTEVEFLNGPGAELFSLFGIEPPALEISWMPEEEDLLLGEESFQVIHVPGHSPGSIALYSPSRAMLFSGDVIFDQSIGRTDFPGGNGTLLKQSIEKLAELPAVCVLPGHMAIVDGDANVKRNFKIITDHFFPYL